MKNVNSIFHRLKVASTIFRKLVIVFAILLVINVTVFFSSVPMNASGYPDDSTSVYVKASVLLYENFMLRKKYTELEKRLNDIEYELISINDYDNYIYYQTLNIDRDNIDLPTFKNYSNFETIPIDSIFTYLDKRSLNVSYMASSQLEEMIQTSEEIKKNKKLLNYYPTISPIKTADFIRIASGFGWRKHPIYHTVLFHNGIDIDAKKGVKVYATMDGIVDKVVYSKFGYGNKIIIKNSRGFETLYAHLGKMFVKKGQIINKGDIIGTVSNTGLATGDHLHYEIHENGELKDPLAYFYTYLTTNWLAENGNKD
jgi:murein DD-endopeptidase MepM/ murein hydrolase activator NlpD